MKVISIINEKGGVGKTTASVNISYGLVERLMNDGKRILLIDADAQGNATKFFLPEFKSITLEEFNMLEVPENCDIRSSTKFIKNSLISMLGERNDLNKLLLEGKGVIRECIHQTQYQQLDIIPSIGTELIATDKLLGASTGQRHVILKRALREIRNDYDIVIIDHAPTFNNITVNGLFCSNEIIIPLKPGGFELKGLIDTLEELFDIEDDYLVAKVEKLESAVRELTEGDDDESAKFSIEELAIILDMDVEEIRDVLRLTGDDK